MKKRKGLSRRGFLGGVAAAGAGLTIVPRRVLGGAGYQAPSDTLAVAGIGVGGRGRADVEGCEHEAIVALCDVDWQFAQRTFRSYPQAKRYEDFRVMLEKEPGIDAVVIATPDHTHATIAAAAMRMGKHVYCEKPLTRTIHEARELGRIARETGVVTQMGNQGHAGEGTRQIREWIEAGTIGTVEEIHYWTNRPIWPQAIERPTEMHHVPADLDWDLFLGPAPDRPYHPAYHPFRWRGWWDYGTGALGDIACHSMDAAFWTFDLRAPTTIVAEATPLYPETAPAASRIVYRFPATGSQPAMTVVWRDGSLMPPRLPQIDDPDALPFPSGQLFVGDKGLLAAGIYGEDPRLFPDRLHQEVLASPPPERYPRPESVFVEWTEACKGNGTAGSSFAEHAGPLTEMVLLGNLAVRSGREIEWDATTGRVTNVPEANELLHEEYRAGWTL
jgi:predicted dehydrogenase